MICRVLSDRGEWLSNHSFINVYNSAEILFFLDYYSCKRWAWLNLGKLHLQYLTNPIFGRSNNWGRIIFRPNYVKNYLGLVNHLRNSWIKEGIIVKLTSSCLIYTWRKRKDLKENILAGYFKRLYHRQLYF